MKDISKLEEFLQDPQADVGTGLLATRGRGFCFTLKQRSRWGTTPDGRSTFPFGGIGGKLEPGESPTTSLHREAIEEVGSDVKILEPSGEVVLMDNDSIRIAPLNTSLEREQLPIIIFKSPRGEPGRKPYTYVLIYLGEFTDEIQPIDDPALVELNKELLARVVQSPTTLTDFRDAGGTVTSNVDLPPEGILKPVGTAIAAARCLEAGIIANLRLNKEAMQLWSKF